MSTKCSLAWGRNENYDFHLYSECFDDDNVYLDITNKKTKTTTEAIVIPIVVWEVIRKFTNFNPTLANKTDEEILAQSVKFVEDRIASLQHRQGTTGIFDLCGAMIYGSIDDPVSVQIQAGVEHDTAERAKQQQMLAEIEQFNKEMKR